MKKSHQPPSGRVTANGTAIKFQTQASFVCDDGFPARGQLEDHIRTTHNVPRAMVHREMMKNLYGEELAEAISLSLQSFTIMDFSEIRSFNITVTWLKYRERVQGVLAML